jgi:hypothetical protein
MEGTRGRWLGWIAIALGGLALLVALGGRMQPHWVRYHGPPAFQAGPRGQFGPDAQPGPQGQFGPREQFGPWDQAGPRGQFGPREQFEFRRHWGGPSHGFRFFFFPFMLIGGLLKLLFVGLLIWLGLRLIRGSGPSGPSSRGPSGPSDPPSRPGPEQPPYTGDTQQM